MHKQVRDREEALEHVRLSSQHHRAAVRIVNVHCTNMYLPATMQR